MSRLIQRLRESLAFPIVLYWFAELGQCQNLSQMLSFTWNRFRVALFGCLLVAAIFWTLAFWSGGSGSAQPLLVSFS